MSRHTPKRDPPVSREDRSGREAYDYFSVGAAYVHGGERVTPLPLSDQ